MYEELMTSDDPVTEYIRRILGDNVTQEQRDQIMMQPAHRVAIDEIYRRSGGMNPTTQGQADTLVGSLYRDILGREPTRGNVSMDAGPEAYAQSLMNGGNFGDMQALFRMNRDLGERDVHPDLGHSQHIARLQTAGLNRMPGVMGDYLGFMGGDAHGRFIGTPPANQQYMQPGGMNDWRSMLKNPLMAQDAPAPAPGGIAPAATNPLLTDDGTQAKIKPQYDQNGNPLFN
jgi:hypothetical protein